MLISLMSQTDVLMFNRVVGLGIDSDISEDDIDNIIAKVQSSGSQTLLHPVIADCHSERSAGYPYIQGLSSS